MQDPDDDFLYQPHRARGERLDPALRRMVFAAGGVSMLVIVVALGWSGFRTGGFGPPPVVNPPDTPLRIAPASPGGLVVPGANVPIMSGDTGSGATPQLAPAGQAPDVAELDQAAGLNQPPPAPPAAAPQPAAAQSAPAPAAAAPAPQASAAAPGAPTDVQLAATQDEPSAASTWASLQKKYPDLLGDKKPMIIPAVVNGQSVWRLRVSGFPSAGAAKSFCDQLTAKGAQCAVAAF